MIYRGVQQIDFVNETAREFLRWHIEQIKNQNIDSYSAVTLSRSQRKDLSKRVLSLPDEGLNLLFGIYVMSQTPESVAKIFDIEDVLGRTYYYTQLLSYAMGLRRGEIIATVSMRKSCNRAMLFYAKTVLYQKRESKSIVKGVLQAVAAAFLIIAISIGTAMGVNAEFREKTLRWFLMLFRDYGVFRVDNTEGIVSSADVFYPEYIPERFILQEERISDTSCYYFYTSNDNTSLMIEISKAGGNYNLNNENTESKQIIFGGNTAYIIDGLEYCQLLFQIDDSVCFIDGNITKAELLKIASNIENKKNPKR